MHITITGNLGSGKSTICRLLSEKYSFEIYSTGKVQRELARQMNMTTLELNQLMRSDQKYDKMIDDETARISRENKDKDIIFDSRLAWHFVESSFKVFVSVSLEVAAERVMNDKRGDEEKYTSLEEAIKLLAARAATERVRYKEIYNLNYMDFSNYNLVIDSTYNLPDQIAEIILNEAKEYENNPSYRTKMLVSPKRLIYPEDNKEEDKRRLSKLIDEYKKLPYTIDTIIKVKKQEDDYIILEGHDNAKAALLADVPYIPIDVIKI
ncbi:cytidylate kinase family protein [Mobilitalea sibirica]|uniref:Cytidylate kinase family protein n=1 Tax=Mobilitalea sibirica TaxID=1462919 RepID=A0A8J7L362_9FIRM|nr:cytidylate kinase family protein [Mobilitalea sibirica]MBH1941888.1 cytidylate kinase family protein [Mobilitalea sibirica]